LDDGDPRGLGCRRCGGGIDGLDNLIHLGRNKRVRKLQKIQLEGRCYDGDFIALQDLVSDRFAGVDRGAEMMRSSKRHIDKPNTAASFVSFEIWVPCSALVCGQRRHID